MFVSSKSLRFLLASAVVCSASASDKQLQHNRNNDPTTKTASTGPLRRHLNNRQRVHKSLFVDKAAATVSAVASETKPCQAYDPSSKVQYLCKQIEAYTSNGSGNKSGVVKNICKAIDEIYDSVIVVDVVETAGLSLDDVLALGM